MGISRSSRASDHGSLAASDDAIVVRDHGGQTRAAPADRDESGRAGCALRTLAGAFVVIWSFRLSGYLTFGTWLAVPVVGLGLAGLSAIIVAWLPAEVIGTRRLRQLDWAVLVAVLAAFAMWSYFQIFTAPDYGTDEIAFDQYAAQLALQGINPYLHSMAPAFPLFHVSPNGYTFQLNGQPVTTLSYPALSFEAYMPLLAARHQDAGGRLDGHWRLGARGRAFSSRCCRGDWRRWPRWWQAWTCTSVMPSAGSPTSCSCRCS